MTVLQTHGIGVAWRSSVPVFEDVSLSLDRRVFGLVGANGAGKTTLLALLAGRAQPHEGRITLSPADAIVAFCPQRVDALDDDVRALAARDDALANELRGRLALEDDARALSEWSTLSPGERKRWQIAAALAREPDVLLLDEPTNHLDREGRSKLVSALRRFRGIGVVVSHDRALLDEITTETLRIFDRTVTRYPASYSEARLLWLGERAQAEAAHGAARDRVRHLEAQLDVARRAQAGATPAKSTRTRMKDKNDSDARGVLATTKAAWAEARAGREVSTVRGDLHRAREAVPTIERDRTLGGKVFAHYERAPNHVLFHLEQPVLTAGEGSAHVVLRDVRLTIARDDRVHLEGANGAGKTTLLEAVVGEFGRPERVLFLPQELALASIDAALTRLRASDADTKGRVLSIFAALGSDPESILRGSAQTFSPGEGRKLVLAEALGRAVWALVLDEPTNHLDLPSIEKLEAALEAYPGCLLLVTHDDAFAARLTTRSVRVEGGRLR